MNKYNVEGLIIKNLNYKDTDKIYTIFSKGKGKFSASARGVRKFISRRAGSLDTMNLVSMSLTENKNGYKTINEVRVINSFKNIKKSLEILAKGYYILELIHRFMEEDSEHSEVFDLSVRILEKMDRLDRAEDLGVLVNYFELSLMKMLGYGVQDTSALQEYLRGNDQEGFDSKVKDHVRNVLGRDLASIKVFDL